jgi:DNA-binding MarR family transcriptional regulator/ribosomal protein S18 acetylase RimI-like enzyme
VTTDLIADSGYLFLGSRLRRLAVQMQGDANQVSQRAGVAVQPGQYPLLALLSQRGPQTVGELVRAMGLSQPVTTRNIGKLSSLGLVKVDRSSADGRSRIVSLSPAGERAMDRSRETVWPQVEAAVRQVVDGLSGPLLDQIGQIERALAERSLAERAALIAVSQLVRARDADVPSIVALMNLAYRGSGRSAGWNTEAGYITGDRTTEPLLRADLAASPEASLLVWRDQREGTLKGCVWLEPLGEDTWYLGSLAVDPQRQNGGLGHALLCCAERWVRERGGKRVSMSVVNVRKALIEWYLRRGYHATGEIKPFPYGDDRFGTPLRADLNFLILEKDLRLADGIG